MEVGTAIGIFVSNIQTYYLAILLLGGFVLSLIILFGKIISAEVPWYQSGEHEFLISGLFFIFRVFALPLQLILFIILVWQAMSGGVIPNPQLSFIDFILICAIAFLDYLMTNELNRFNERLGKFDKHTEYSKKKKVATWSYLLCPIAFFLLLFQVWLHISEDSFSYFGIVSIAFNSLLVLLAFFITAVVNGVSQPKFLMDIYLVGAKKPLTAYFIRWENECIRVVPEKLPSLLIPRDQIRKIEYPEFGEENKIKEPPKGIKAWLKNYLYDLAGNLKSVADSL
jgi:hypothetical protein